MLKSNNPSDNILCRPAARWLALLSWGGFILWLSLMPSPPAAPGILGWDKLQHFLAYGLLALLIARVLECRRAGANRHAWWQAWLVAVLFGLLLELLQGSMRYGRSAEWPDLIADALGALLACVLFRQVERAKWKRLTGE